MNRSKLGIITDEVSHDLIEALDWVQYNGLKHVEIRTVNGTNAIELPDVTLEWVIREVERRGLFVSCFASPVFKCSLHSSYPVTTGDTFGDSAADVNVHFEKLLRAIQIGKILGTRNIRIFSFWREQEPSMHVNDIVHHLRKAAQIAIEQDALLLLENEPACNGGFAAEVQQIVRDVNSEALKALWDPGNEVYGGRSAFPEGYAAIKNMVQHIHLKDALFNDKGQPRCVPIGMGNVPYVEHFKALEQDGYSGLYTLETHFIPEGGTAKDGSKMSLDGLRAQK